MTRATARHGGAPAPYTRKRKLPFDYHAMYKRFPHLRHWKHNPISHGYAALLLHRKEDE